MIDLVFKWYLSHTLYIALWQGAGMTLIVKWIGSRPLGQVAYGL